jgi:hypothetical protein
MGDVGIGKTDGLGDMLDQAAGPGSQNNPHGGGKGEALFQENGAFFHLVPEILHGHVIPSILN